MKRNIQKIALFLMLLSGFTFNLQKGDWQLTTTPAKACGCTFDVFDFWEPPCAAGYSSGDGYYDDDGGDDYDYGDDDFGDDDWWNTDEPTSCGGGVTHTILSSDGYNVTEEVCGLTVDCNTGQVINTDCYIKTYTIDPATDKFDCNGDLNGSATMSSCGCIGGNTGIPDCNQVTIGDSGETTPNKDKPIALRTDCPPSAATNSNAVNNKMGATLDIVTKINTLEGYAQNASIEYSGCIDYDGTGFSVGGNQLYPGSNGSSSGMQDTNTEIMLHSHPCDPNNTYGLSGGDIKTLMDASQTDKKLQAIVAVQCDGSQVMAYIDDPAMFKLFTDNFNSVTTTMSSGQFDYVTLLGISYWDSYKDLLSQGYSKTQANMYGMEYALNIWDVGLKLYYKAPNSSDFKEMETTISDSGSMTPSICPPTN